MMEEYISSNPMENDVLSGVNLSSDEIHFNADSVGENQYERSLRLENTRNTVVEVSLYVSKEITDDNSSAAKEYSYSIQPSSLVILPNSTNVIIVHLNTYCSVRGKEKQCFNDRDHLIIQGKTIEQRVPITLHWFTSVSVEVNDHTSKTSSDHIIARLRKENDSLKSQLQSSQSSLKMTEADALHLQSLVDNLSSDRVPDLSRMVDMIMTNERNYAEQQAERVLGILEEKDRIISSSEESEKKAMARIADTETAANNAVTEKLAMLETVRKTEEEISKLHKVVRLFESESYREKQRAEQMAAEEWALREKFKEKSSLVEESDKRNHSLMEQIKNQLSDLDDMKKRTDVAESNSEQCCKDLIAMRKRTAEDNETKTSLLSQLNDHKLYIGELIQKLNVLEEDRDTFLETQVSRIEKEANEAIRIAHTESQQAMEAKNSLQQRIMLQDKEITDLKQNSETLRMQCTSFEVRVRELTAALAQKEVTVSERTEELTRIRVTHNEVETLRQQLNDCLISKDKANDKLADVKNELFCSEKRVIQLQEEHTKQITREKSRASVAENTLAELRSVKECLSKEKIARQEAEAEVAKMLPIYELGHRISNAEEDLVAERLSHDRTRIQLNAIRDSHDNLLQRAARGLNNESRTSENNINKRNVWDDPEECAASETMVSPALDISLSLAIQESRHEARETAIITERDLLYAECSSLSKSLHDSRARVAELSLLASDVKTVASEFALVIVENVELKEALNLIHHGDETKKLSVSFIASEFDESKNILKNYDNSSASKTDIVDQATARKNDDTALMLAARLRTSIRNELSLREAMITRDRDIQKLIARLGDLIRTVDGHCIVPTDVALDAARSYATDVRIASKDAEISELGLALTRSEDRFAELESRIKDTNNNKANDIIAETLRALDLERVERRKDAEDGSRLISEAMNRVRNNEKVMSLISELSQCRIKADQLSSEVESKHVLLMTERSSNTELRRELADTVKQLHQRQVRQSGTDSRESREKRSTQSTLDSVTRIADLEMEITELRLECCRLRECQGKEDRRQHGRKKEKNPKRYEKSAREEVDGECKNEFIKETETLRDSLKLCDDERQRLLRVNLEERGSASLLSDEITKLKLSHVQMNSLHNREKERLLLAISGLRIALTQVQDDVTIISENDLSKAHNTSNVSIINLSGRLTPSIMSEECDETLLESTLLDTTAMTTNTNDVARLRNEFSSFHHRHSATLALLASHVSKIRTTPLVTDDGNSVRQLAAFVSILQSQLGALSLAILGDQPLPAALIDDLLKDSAKEASLLTNRLAAIESECSTLVEAINLRVGAHNDNQDVKANFDCSCRKCDLHMARVEELQNEQVNLQRDNKLLSSRVEELRKERSVLHERLNMVEMKESHLVAEAKTLKSAVVIAKDKCEAFEHRAKAAESARKDNDIDRNKLQARLESIIEERFKVIAQRDRLRDRCDILEKEKKRIETLELELTNTRQLCEDARVREKKTSREMSRKTELLRDMQAQSSEREAEYKRAAESEKKLIDQVRSLTSERGRKERLLTDARTAADSARSEVVLIENRTTSRITSLERKLEEVSLCLKSGHEILRLILSAIRRFASAICNDIMNTVSTLDCAYDHQPIINSNSRKNGGNNLQDRNTVIKCAKSISDSLLNLDAADFEDIMTDRNYESSFRSSPKEMRSLNEHAQQTFTAIERICHSFAGIIDRNKKDNNNDMKATSDDLIVLLVDLVSKLVIAEREHATISIEDLGVV